MSIGLAIGQTLLTPGSISIRERMRLYAQIHQFIMPKDPAASQSRRLELYDFLESYIRQHLQNVRREILLPSMPREQVSVYLLRWRRFHAAALCNKRLFKYLEQQWIRPEQDRETLKVSQGMQRSWVPMDIDQLHFHVWLEVVLEKEDLSIFHLLINEIFEDGAEGSDEDGDQGDERTKGRENDGRKDSKKSASDVAGHPWRRDKELAEVRRGLIDMGVISDGEEHGEDEAADEAESDEEYID